MARNMAQAQLQANIAHLVQAAPHQQFIIPSTLDTPQNLYFDDNTAQISNVFNQTRSKNHPVNFL